MVFDLSSQTLNIFLAFLVSWLITLSFFLFKSISHYNQLTARAGRKGLRKILEKILKNLALSEKEIESLKKRIDQLEDDGIYPLQKIGLLKFNPFREIGGKQSFVLSLLNKKGSGFLITSLHGRETTRLYVKMVKEGRGVDFELSEEEKEAIKKAKKI